MTVIHALGRRWEIAAADQLAASLREKITLYRTAALSRPQEGAEARGRTLRLNRFILLASLMSLAVFRPLSSTPAATSSISLPATFTGSSCSADVTLTLHRDGTAFERVVSRGRELANGSGRFTIDPSRKEVILGNAYIAHGATFYQIVDERTLQRLGSSGGPPDSSCDERLRRSAKVTEISGVMKPVTLFSYVWTAEKLGGITMTPKDASQRFTLDPRARTIGGSTGCGTLSGSYATNGAEIRFYHIAVDRAPCSNQVLQLSKTFIAALKKTKSFHLCCMTLELRDALHEIAQFRTTRV